MKESVEDSDGVFDMFDSDGDDDTEYKVSMKWKLARKAKFLDKDNKEVFIIKLKIFINFSKLSKLTLNFTYF